MNEANKGAYGSPVTAPASPGHVAIYMATPETTIYRTVGVEVMTAESLLSATERVAAYIYEDLRELSGKAGISLAQVAEMPPVSTNDPNLFHRLLCLDIEHLLRDRHTTDLALLLSDPAPSADGRVKLRYRASYHVVRLVDWAKSIEDAEIASTAVTSNIPSGITRHGERYDPARYSSEPEGRFALAVKWNPQTAATREIAMRYPQYHFHWSPAGSVTFDDRALQANGVHALSSSGTGPLPTPTLSAQLSAGLSPSLDGTWTLNTIQHTVPNAYRTRPKKKP